MCVHLTFTSLSGEKLFDRDLYTNQEGELTVTLNDIDVEMVAEVSEFIFPTVISVTIYARFTKVMRKVFLLS